MKLYYVFDSDYVEKGYESYEGIEFEYELNDLEAKEFVAEYYTGAHGEVEVVLDVLEQLDYEGLLNWVQVLDTFYDTLRKKYIADAMQWYADKYLTKIETKEEE